MEKIVILIDGSNLWSAAKTLGVTLDYKLLLQHFGKERYLVRALYFTATKAEQEIDNLRPLLDWLDYNGYTMVTKLMKEWTDPETGDKVTKGNMDIEISVELMRYSRLVNHIFLFTGDGDFRYAVEAAQKEGVRVTVISTIVTQPPMIANELRRQADDFIDLASRQLQGIMKVDEKEQRERRRLGHALTS